MKKILLLTALLSLSGCANLKDQIKNLKTEQDILTTTNVDLQKRNDLMLLQKHYLCAWVLEERIMRPYMGKYEFLILGELERYATMDEDCEKAVDLYMKEVSKRRESFLNE